MGEKTGKARGGRINLAISPTLKDRLETLAVIEGYSLNGLIEKTMAAYADKHAAKIDEFKAFRENLNAKYSDN